MFNEKKSDMVIIFLLLLFSTPGELKGRSIPLPIHASKETRTSIEAMDSRPRKPFSVPEDKKGWKELIRTFDEPGIRQGIDLSEDLGVTYERSMIQGVEVFSLTPSEISPRYRDNLFLHIHGGAFIFGGEEASLRESVRIAHELKIPVISINYRKAPDYPAPAALNDIIILWNHITSTRPADTIIMGGTSAGGNLTTAATMRMRDLGLPLPGALFIGTPAADLNGATDSRFLMEGIDINLWAWDDSLQAVSRLYYGYMDPVDPYISPIYGDFTGFPPAILVSGTRDLLLSDTVLLHRAIRDAGAVADLHIYEGHSHGSYLMPGRDLDNFFSELDTFADTHLSRHRRVRSRMLHKPLPLEDIVISEDIY